MLMATESARVMMILMIVLMIVMPTEAGGHDAIKHKHVGSHHPSIQQVKNAFHSLAPPQASKIILCMHTPTTKTLT